MAPDEYSEGEEPVYYDEEEPLEEEYGQEEEGQLGDQ